MLVETIFDTANAKVRLVGKKYKLVIQILNILLRKFNMVLERAISNCLLNMCQGFIC